MDRDNSVFISRIQLLQNPNGAARLKTVTNNVYWDPKTQGVYITKNSTAYSLCLLLGFDPYGNRIIEDGVYDRSGKIK